MTFLPGQFSKVVFDKDRPDNSAQNKFLSFSSPPQAPYMEMTKRLSQSVFSEKLRTLEKGDEVSFLGPMGACTFQDDFSKIGFLIGGIGITPVMSIAGYVIAKQLPVDMVLIYANRDKEHIAFQQELRAFSKECPGLHLLFAVDEGPCPDPHFHLGRIDRQLIETGMPDYRNRTIFSYGPPAMVKAMCELCLDMGCQRENLRTEIFAGY